MAVFFNGKKLRDTRKALSLTQEKLAEFSGLSDRHLRTLETRQVDPSFSSVFRICRAVGISMEELATVTDEDGEEMSGRENGKQQS